MRVAIVAGYFDWFSGYQETALARTLAGRAEVEIIASDRVGPTFSQAHLETLGIDRRYEPSVRNDEHGASVTRFRTVEKRSMVWSNEAMRYLRHNQYDLVIQVMPGQGLPVAPSIARAGGRRVVLYGDNSAMWAGLSSAQKRIKWAVFAATKGAMYRFVNRRAHHLFGYTPETVSRLARFSAGASSSVLPLSFDPDRFFFDPILRREKRAELGYKSDDVVVIAAGKFQKEKNLELILEAFSARLGNDERIRLLVVGADETPYAQRFQDLISKEKILMERTTVLGFQDADRLNALFNAADLGVWPAQPAITIQQAMGTGLAVVLPRNEWVGHLVRPNSGRYFEARLGADSLATAIRDAVNSEVEGQSRSSRVRTNAWLSSPNVASELLARAGVE